MFNIGFGIAWPWSHRWDNLSNMDCSLSENKALEINVYRNSILLEARLEISHAEDHAGATVWLGLLGFNLEIRFYDKRHWNYDANRWYLPGEEFLDDPAESDSL